MRMRREREFVAVGLLLCLCRGLPRSEALPQRCAFQNCTAFYYSTVQNTNVSFHYAWSFVGFPTLLMFYSNGSANSNSCSCSDGISVSNEYFVNQTHGSVSIGDFEKSVAFAVVFRQLIEAEVDSAQGVEFFNFSSGVSSAYNSFPLDTTLASLSIIDNTAINLTYPDSLSIINKVGTSSVAGQLSYLPRTHYTENSTTFDLIVQNFPYRSNTSRVVLEMYIVPGPALDATGRVQFNHSIDDEYTPSIFETCTYLFGGSYLQWKPISYQDSSRSSTTSQQAKYLSYQGLAPGDHGGLPRGLASAIFAPGTNVTRFYMVIGTSGDATYLSSEYFTWTAVVGYGTAPQEHISTMAIIILCVGFGLPMATVIMGGIYVVYKRKPWQNLYGLMVSVRAKRSGFIPVVVNGTTDEDDN